MRHHYEADITPRSASPVRSALSRGEETAADVHRFHPYVIGRPHRIKYLAEVWTISCRTIGCAAPTDEIAEYYLANYYEQAVAHAARVNQ